MTVHLRIPDSTVTAAVTTVPAVLTADAPEPADLVVTLTTADATAAVHGLEIRFATGPGALTETADPPQATAGPGNFSIDRRTEGGVESFDCRADPAIIVEPGAPVTVTVRGIRLSGRSGHIPVELITDLGDPAGGRHLQLTTAAIAKFPKGFHFEDLAPDSIQVPDGSPVTLSWIGAPAAYRMYWDDRSADLSTVPVDADGRRRWTSPPLTAVTAFMLQATIAEHGDTITHTLNAVVIVAETDLHAETLDIDASVRVGSTTLTPGQAVSDAQLRAQDLTVREMDAGYLGRIDTVGLASTTTLSTAVLSAPGAAIWNGTNKIRMMGAPVKQSAASAGSRTCDTDGFLLVLTHYYYGPDITIDGRVHPVGTRSAACLPYRAGSVVSWTATQGHLLFIPFGR
ncbi:hypothetical protein ACWCPQ_06470 [Nocardia sp. NPDC001965]